MKSALGDDSFREVSFLSVGVRPYMLFCFILMPFLFYYYFSLKYYYLRFQVVGDVQRRSVDVESLLRLHITYSCFEPVQTKMIWVPQAVYKPFYARKKTCVCSTVNRTYLRC